MSLIERLINQNRSESDEKLIKILFCRFSHAMNNNNNNTAASLYGTCLHHTQRYEGTVKNEIFLFMVFCETIVDVAVVISYTTFLTNFLTSNDKTTLILFMAERISFSYCSL